MSSHLVLGLMFGDEGKGRIVSSICKKTENEIKGVVRFSGGHQAAHNVMNKKGFKHTYATLGSASHQGVPTYITDGVMINPETLINELNTLNRSIKDKYMAIHISPNARLVTPFDMLDSKQDSTHVANGTTGMGMRKAVERHEVLPLYASDMLHPEVLKAKLFNYYYTNSDKYYTRIKTDFLLLLDSFILASQIASKFIDPEVRGMHSMERDVVFEGAQGVMLDPWVGFFPNVTATPVLPREFFQVGEVWLVARAYTTRHGNGPMNTFIPRVGVDVTEYSIANQYEMNTACEPQGDFRVEPFDFELFEYALEAFTKSVSNSRICVVKGGVNLVITCMDCVKMDVEETETFLNKVSSIYQKVMNKSSILGIRGLTVDNPYKVYYTDSPYEEDEPRLVKLKSKV